MPECNADDPGDILRDLRREQRLFDAYLAGVRTGTRIPTRDCDREEFRQRVFAGWEAFIDDRSIGPGDAGGE